MKKANKVEEVTSLQEVVAESFSKVSIEESLRNIEALKALTPCQQMKVTAAQLRSDFHTDHQKQVAVMVRDAAVKCHLEQVHAETVARVMARQADEEATRQSKKRPALVFAEPASLASVMIG